MLPAGLDAGKRSRSHSTGCMCREILPAAARLMGTNSNTEKDSIAAETSRSEFRLAVPTRSLDVTTGSQVG